MGECLPGCMYMYHMLAWCSQWSERASGLRKGASDPLGTEAMISCETSRECWKSGPLREEQVL